MKQFSCGDVVPGCQRTFSAPDEGTILSLVRDHASADHGLAYVPSSLMDQVRGAVRAA